MHCEVATWAGGDALSISGSTVEMLKGYQSYEFGHSELIRIMHQYIAPVKEDKFILAGYNTVFDKNMLFGMDESLGCQEMYKYIDHRVIDVMSIARAVYAIGKFPDEPKDFKLVTLCQMFGIDIKAHQALSNIQATRKLFFVLTKLLGG